MAQAELRRSDGGTLPLVGNLVGAFVLLILVLAIVLRAQQTPPPQIAEFAPQAQHPITQAPSEQTSALGRGQGGAAIGPAPAPSPSPLPTSAIFLHCVGDPPRQTEDPQSPPCVPYWTPPPGGNGGATSRGVTATSVSIAEPSCDKGVTQALTQFFNTRYELYGRQLVITCQGQNSCTASIQRNDAAAAAQTGYFGSLFYNACGGVDYMDELANRQVIGVNSFGPTLEQSYMASKAPYLWQYEMELDSTLRNLGAWVCARLAGGKAVHAGDPLIQAEPRKFGIIWNQASPDVPGSVAPLRQELDSCGANRDSFEDDFTTSGGADTGAQNAILRFQSDHVTSVFCLCGIEGDTVYAESATAAHYFPEWLLSSYTTEDYNQDLGLVWPSEQRVDAMGITVQPRQIRWADDPTAWALAAGNPSGGWITSSGAPTNTQEQPDTLHEYYRGLLILASGIQLAGPRLTPQSFAAGLHRSLFPNPDTSIRAGHVDFVGGSYSMTVDAAEYWWSNTAQSPYGNDDGAGSICYVDHGARHALGSWPRGGDPFFAQACDSGGYPGDP